MFHFDSWYVSLLSVIRLHETNGSQINYSLRKWLTNYHILCQIHSIKHPTYCACRPHGKVRRRHDDVCCKIFHFMTKTLAHSTYRICHCVCFDSGLTALVSCPLYYRDGSHTALHVFINSDWLGCANKPPARFAQFT